MPFTSTVLSSGPYTPNGVTTNFPYYFLALTDEEVQIVLTDPDGIETVVTTGFEITDVGNPAGGFVIFSLAPGYTGRTLTVRAVPSFAQETDFSNQGSYNPVEVNRALDRAAQRAIYLRDQIALGVVPEGGVGTVTWASIQGKPTTFTPSAHAHAGEDITTGTVAAARIASLDATKIATGAFDPARIPSIDASKITSGTIDPARIPPTPSSVVSSGDITALTGPQQALISEGVIVTLSTGERYVYDGSGSKTDLANYVEIGDATPAWADVSGKPANVVALGALVLAANKLPYATGVGTLALTDFSATGRAIVALASQNAAIAYTSPLTTKGDLYGYAAAPVRLPVGVDGQVLTADAAQAAGVKWANSVGGGGAANMPLFTSVFSGNGDGVTSNNAAFTAAEGSAYDYIWLPEGTYKTTLTTSQLTKRYVGPGKIFRGTGGAGAYSNYSRYSADVHPTVDASLSYGRAENLEFSTTEWFEIAPGMRRNLDRYLATGPNPNGYPLYYWAPNVPHFMDFKNGGGWSGLSGLTTTTITSGVTTSVTIGGGVMKSDGTQGWFVGDTVGFAAAMDGYCDPANHRVLTGVNTGTGVISWLGALNATYAIGTNVTHGYRTHTSAYTVIMEQNGGGDAGAFFARMDVGYTKFNSQTEFQYGSTGFLFGGEITLSKPGAYGTGQEYAYADNGVASTCLAGTVSNYARKNNDGAYGSFWIHDLVKMDGGGLGYPAFGTKPITSVYNVAMAALTGLDFTRSAFSVAAVALPIDQKIAFDAQVVSPGPANGNGWAATTTGNMYITGSVISAVKTLELQNNGYRLRLKADGGLTTNAGFTTSSTVLASGSVTAGAGLWSVNPAGPPHAIYFGDASTRIIFDGSSLGIYVNGVLKMSWA